MSRALSISELADMLAATPDVCEEMSYGAMMARGETAVLPTDGGFELPELDAAAPVAPRHFAPSPEIAKALSAMPQPSDDDPIRAAWKSGFEDGVATEKRLSREMIGEDSAAINQLRDQIRQIDHASMQMLESRMREAVVALCRQVIDDCVVPPERLAARIGTAVRMLTGSHNEKSIQVSPADLVLLTGLLPADWTITADADLVRGAIRVVTPEGGVEDGPEQWKLALEEAIRTC